MLSVKRSILLTGLSAGLLGLLTACANGPNGSTLERTFAADPNIDASPIGVRSPTRNPQSQTTVALPDDFPSEIPLYPEAQLQRVEPLTVPSAEGQRTAWSSADPSNLIGSFYQKAFASGNWEIVSEPNEEAGGTLVARQDGLQVTVSIPFGAAPNPITRSPAASPSPTSSTAGATEFEIQYIRNQGETVASPSESEGSSEPETTNGSAPSQRFADLGKAPQELRQYIEDLAALGVLTLHSNSPSTQFDPNKTITRREYARWLVAANNRIYADRPGQQIRLASETTQPAFRDVPRTDPDFQNIQALAEAGLIPSSLTGDAAAVLFRPDAPLTRENLVAWKVPLDTRQTLPTASIDAIKQTWGFQDVNKIDSKALRAVLADFQNGDQANIRRMLGYTTLFQPKKPVTRAEAAAVLWYFGSQGDGLSAKDAQELNAQTSQPSATPEPTPSSSSR